MDYDNYDIDPPSMLQDEENDFLDDEYNKNIIFNMNDKIDNKKNKETTEKEKPKDKEQVKGKQDKPLISNNLSNSLYKTEVEVVSQPKNQFTQQKSQPVPPVQPIQQIKASNLNNSGFDYKHNNDDDYEENDDEIAQKMNNLKIDLNSKPDVVLAPAKISSNPNRPTSSKYNVKPPSNTNSNTNVGKVGNLTDKSKGSTLNKPPENKKVFTNDKKREEINSNLNPKPKDKENIDINKNKEEYDETNFNMEKAFDKMNNFEKNLKNQKFEYGFDENNNDSEAEDDLVKEEIPNDTLLSKQELIKRYQLIHTKYKEKLHELKYNSLQIIEMNKKHQEFMETISKDTQTDLKEKKIIELHKKNQDLNLKIEKHKLKISNLEKTIEALKNLEENITPEDREKKKKEKDKERDKEKEKSEKIPTPQDLMSGLPDDPQELKKRIKQSDTKIVELRQKVQTLKDDNFKLNICLKREIGGDNIDLDKLVKDKSAWKGRSEIIEGLKVKVKQLESTINSNNISKFYFNIVNIINLCFIY